MSASAFNLAELFLAVDAERERQGLSWTALAKHVGVAASTIRRYATADDAEADGVLVLLRWLGAAPEAFVAGDAVKARRLPVGGGGVIRVDMELVVAANGDPRGARGRTRTTIQRLVETAQNLGQPVASLTRLSEV